MPPHKPRDIRPEELELWNKVVRQAEPLHPERPISAPAAKPASVNPNPPRPVHKHVRIGEASSPRRPSQDLAPPIADRLHQQPLRMDRKRFGQMKKGRLSPEGRIDLHGMTLAQAHPVLIRFILDAVADDNRLVLVITGKGKIRDDLGPVPQRLGVLRHQVPHWLHSMPLKPYVLQIAEAHVKHGGAGAYYVYLRRAKS